MSCAPLSAAESDRLPLYGVLSQKNAHQLAAPRQTGNYRRPKYLAKERIPKYAWPRGHRRAAESLEKLGGRQVLLDMRRHHATMSWLMLELPARLDRGMTFTLGEYMDAANSHPRVSGCKRTLRYQKASIQARISKLVQAGLLLVRGARYCPTNFKNAQAAYFANAEARSLEHHDVNNRRRHLANVPLPPMEEGFAEAKTTAANDQGSDQPGFKTTPEVPCDGADKQSPDSRWEEGTALDPNHQVLDADLSAESTMGNRPCETEAEREEILAAFAELRNEHAQAKPIATVPMSVAGTLQAAQAQLAQDYVKFGWRNFKISVQDEVWLEKFMRGKTMGSVQAGILGRRHKAWADAQRTQEAANEEALGRPKVLSRLPALPTTHRFPLRAQCRDSLIALRSTVEAEIATYLRHPKARAAAIVNAQARVDTISRLVIAKRHSQATRGELATLKGLFACLHDLNVRSAQALGAPYDLWLYEAEQMNLKETQATNPAGMLRARVAKWHGRA